MLTAIDDQAEPSWQGGRPEPIASDTGHPTQPMLVALAADGAGNDWIGDQPQEEPSAVRHQQIALRFGSDREVRLAERVTILREIGAGSNGTIHEAVDRRLGRHIAIKTVRTGDRDRNQIQQLIDEAEILAQLQHPAIVRLFDVIFEDDQIHYLLELVDGVDLATWVASTPRSWEQIAGVLAKIADGLGHAHHLGIIHRDIKPANILVDRHGEPHILDFGLARRMATRTRTSDHAGRVVGTPLYLAPEMAQQPPRDAGSATDIWSFGATAFHLLTGRPVFDGRNLVELIDRIRSDPVPDPQECLPDLPTPLAAICRRCLQRDPTDRYHNARQVAEDLRRFVYHLPTRAVIEQDRTGHRLWTSLALGLLLVVIAGLILEGYRALNPPAPGASPDQTTSAETTTRSEWLTVVDWRHTDATAPPGDRLSPTLEPLDVPAPEAPPYWLWLEDPALGDEIRCITRWSIPVDDAIDFVIHGHRRTLSRSWRLPPGRVGKLRWTPSPTLWTAHVDHLDAPSQAGARISCTHQPEVTVEVRMAGDTLSVLIDGHLVHRDFDPLPIVGQQPGHAVGLRWYRPETRLLAWRVERSDRSLGNPLATGRALQRLGHHDLASAEFLAVAADAEETPLRHRALLQAYISARLCAQDERADTVRARIQADPALGATADALVAFDTRLAWSAGKCDTALDGLAHCIDRGLGSPVLADLLEAPPATIDHAAAQRLLRLLRLSTYRPEHLDLTNLPLDDCRDLHGLPLATLNISGTRIADLGPLAAAGLERLYARNCPITDLGPLAQAPLVELDIAGTQVADLDCLADRPGFTSLNISRTPISSLEPLRGMTIDSLICAQIALADWSPLQSMSITLLRCGDTDLGSNPAALRIPGLEVLSAPRIDLRDCQPLLQPALRSLDLAYNPLVEIANLDQAPALEVLELDGCPITRLPQLDGLPLRRLHLRGTGLTSLPNLPEGRLEILDLAATDIDLQSFRGPWPQRILFPRAAPGPTLIDHLPPLDEAHPIQRQIELLRWWHDEPRQVSDRARSTATGRWLILPLCTDHAGAQDLARQIGGRLAQPGDKSAVAALVEQMALTGSAWIDLSGTGPRLPWSSLSGPPQARPSLLTGRAACLSSNGSVHVLPVDSLLHVAVEWPLEPSQP